MTTDLTKVAEDSARGGFFLITGNVASTIIMALSTILIGRFLGPELYGEYGLSIIVPQMLFIFADFGLAAGVTKFAASLRAEGKTSRAAKIIEYATFLRAAIALLFFLFNFALADFLAAVLLRRPDLGFYVRLASITIPFNMISTLAISAYLGLDKTQYSAFTANIQAISKAAISIMLVLLGFSVAGAVTGHVSSHIIGGVVATSILVFLLRKYAKNRGDDVGFTDSIKTLMRYGVPLYLSGILVGFIHPYQNFVLAFFTPTVDIGNWKAARNFVALMSIVSMPITSALFTAFSKLDSTMSEDETVTFFKFANKYTTLLIVPVTILLITFSNEIVQVIYGSTYQTAASFLSISCLLFFLVGLGYLNLDSLFNGLGETRTTLKTSLVAALIIFTLSPLLANTYGVLGVLVALIVAHATSTCYGMYIAKRDFQIRFDTTALIKIYTIGVIATAPALLLLQISPLPTFINVIVGGLFYIFVYATLLSLAKVVSVSELETATKITQRTKLLALLVKPFVWYHRKISKRQKPTDKRP